MFGAESQESQRERLIDILQNEIIEFKPEISAQIFTCVPLWVDYVIALCSDAFKR